MPDPKQAVTLDVALALVREHLSATRGYPNDDGQKALARYLIKCAISVKHAQSIVETFRHECPTPQEMHDVAWDDNQRAKFLPPSPPPEELWKAQGYTLDAGYYQQVQYEMRSRAPGEPREIDLMYRAVKQKLKIKDWTNVPWGRIWSTARDLGFPLNTEQREDAARWERSQPKSETRRPEEECKVSNGGTTPPRLITQADIDAARRKRAADSKGGEDGRDAE